MNSHLITTMKVGGVALASHQLPKLLPVPKPRWRKKDHLMRQGSQGPGVRVIQALGAHPSYYSLSFTAYALTSAQVSNLEALMSTQSTFSISINWGSGSKSYTAVFAEDGLDPSLPENAGYDSNAYQCVIKLELLGN